MNHLKLHLIIERIKHSEDFPFDVWDVADEIDLVLSFFGIPDVFTDEEMIVIKNDLGEIAENKQSAEVVRLAAERGW
ncbi:hypothetical protein BVX94_02260 [bacterium B17]|nr:hypothetical protein BVX94_02260 [bacterium B17]